MRTNYDRLLEADLADAGISTEEIARINGSLTAADVDALIAAKDSLPAEEAITFSSPERAQKSSSQKIMARPG